MRTHNIRISCLLLLVAVGCSRPHPVQADARFIAHPDNPARKVEFFLQQPAGVGPWPAVVLLHGHQDSPRTGALDFVKWRVLERFARRGYLAVAISQPGYGNSDGPPDFCGPVTQRAVSGVIEKLTQDRLLLPGKVVLEGISRGALVAGLIASRDASIKGIVLISGLYDLPAFTANANSIPSKMIARSLQEETGGGLAALKERSVLSFAGNIMAAALILNGARDDRTDPAQARRLAAVIAEHGGSARAIIYSEFGHQIPVEVRDKDIDPFIDKILAH